MSPSELPDRVADDEALARFLTSSRHYSVQKQLVKPDAFLPEEERRETSVFRTSNVAREQLWELAATVVREGSTRRLHGAALFPANAVRRAKLDVVADEPPVRHAAIRGWPWLDDGKLRKAAHIELALVLTTAAVLLTLEN